jgi:hypothetical protein
MPITNYDKYMPVAGKAGQLANYQDYSADTYAATEVIPYGAAVQLTVDGTGITVLKTGGTPIGVALAQNIHDWVLNADDQKYNQYDPTTVVKKGTIWVEAGEDIIAGKSVNVNPANNKFYPSDTATVGTISFPSAKFKTSATANQLVQVEINLP